MIEGTQPLGSSMVLFKPGDEPAGINFDRYIEP